MSLLDIGITREIIEFFRGMSILFVADIVILGICGFVTLIILFVVWMKIWDIIDYVRERKR